MNTEKTLFVASAALFALACWKHTASAPLKLRAPSPLSAACPPEARALGSALPAQTGLQPHARERKNPFAPVLNAGVPSPQPLPPNNPHLAAERFPIAPPVASTQISEPAPPLELVFSGVVITAGETAALLRTADGSQTWLVGRHARIDTLGCTVVEIEKQAIHVRDRSGRIHILKDRHFQSANFPALMQ